MEPCTLGRLHQGLDSSITIIIASLEANQLYTCTHQWMHEQIHARQERWWTFLLQRVHYSLVRKLAF